MTPSMMLSALSNAGDGNAYDETIEGWLDWNVAYADATWTLTASFEDDQHRKYEATWTLTEVSTKGYDETPEAAPPPA